MAWPTITRRPKSETVEPLDNVVKHQTESSIVIRRRKYTRDRAVFKVTYDLLPTTDANAIVALFAAVNMHTSFTWIDKNSTSKTVMFDKPISYVETMPGWFNFNTFEFIEM
jgi:hypothetical protein